jgi:hypothetical protein
MNDYVNDVDTDRWRHGGQLPAVTAPSGGARPGLLLKERVGVELTARGALALDRLVDDGCGASGATAAGDSGQRWSEHEREDGGTPQRFNQAYVPERCDAGREGDESRSVDGVLCGERR